ncbi:MAG: hypothetical protein K2N84_03405 [Clostridia bacterium]|nr:hypothetical protein [Clostridia bacterium]
MWLKFLLAALIIAFCVFLGYLAAGKHRARKRYFSQLALFNERYLSELSYTRKPLAEFIDSFPYTGDFDKSLKRLTESRNAKVDFPYLTADERKLCSDYFTALGTGDSSAQKGYFSAQKLSLEEKKTESEKECKAKGELYLKLGLLAGLAFVILIV